MITAIEIVLTNIFAGNYQLVQSIRKAKGESGVDENVYTLADSACESQTGGMCTKSKCNENETSELKRVRAAAVPVTV